MIVNIFSFYIYYKIIQNGLKYINAYIIYAYSYVEEHFVCICGIV